MGTLNRHTHIYIYIPSLDSLESPLVSGEAVLQKELEADQIRFSRVS